MQVMPKSTEFLRLLVILDLFTTAFTSDLGRLVVERGKTVPICDVTSVNRVTLQEGGSNCQNKSNENLLCYCSTYEKKNGCTPNTGSMFLCQSEGNWVFLTPLHRAEAGCYVLTIYSKTVSKKTVLIKDSQETAEVIPTDDSMPNARITTVGTKAPTTEITTVDTKAPTTEITMGAVAAVAACLIIFTAVCFICYKMKCCLDSGDSAGNLENIKSLINNRNQIVVNCFKMEDRKQSMPENQSPHQNEDLNHNESMRRQGEEEQKDPDNTSQLCPEAEHLLKSEDGDTTTTINTTANNNNSINKDDDENSNNDGPCIDIGYNNDDSSLNGYVNSNEEDNRKNIIAEKSTVVMLDGNDADETNTDYENCKNDNRKDDSKKIDNDINMKNYNGNSNRDSSNNDDNNRKNNNDDVKIIMDLNDEDDDEPVTAVY